jgi:hypothetical protein
MLQVLSIDGFCDKPTAARRWDKMEFRTQLVVDHQCCLGTFSPQLCHRNHIAKFYYTKPTVSQAGSRRDLASNPASLRAQCAFSTSLCALTAYEGDLFFFVEFCQILCTPAVVLTGHARLQVLICCVSQKMVLRLNSIGTTNLIVVLLEVVCELLHHSIALTGLLVLT